MAESKETAVIYGMPKSAVSTKLVDYIEPLRNVGSFISLRTEIGGKVTMDMNQYLEVFIEESKEHLQNVNDQLMRFEKIPMILVM